MLDLLFLYCQIYEHIYYVVSKSESNHGTSLTSHHNESGTSLYYCTFQGRFCEHVFTGHTLAHPIHSIFVRQALS